MMTFAVPPKQGPSRPGLYVIYDIHKNYTYMNTALTLSLSYT